MWLIELICISLKFAASFAWFVLIYMFILDEEQLRLKHYGPEFLKRAILWEYKFLQVIY